MDGYPSLSERNEGTAVNCSQNHGTGPFFLTTHIKVDTTETVLTNLQIPSNTPLIPHH
jgi:hypothetical protein